MNKNKKNFSKIFDRFSNRIVKVTGSSKAFLIAVILILAWGITGPVFHYSDTWQLVINTSTTIVTFLMVFIIQQSQNKDTMALQLKLNELIAANKLASNRLINIEDLTDKELITLKEFYVRLSKLSKDESDIHKTHSIDEAKENHASKIKK